MSAHASHILQSLDVTCFAVFKRVYGNFIDGKMHSVFNHFDKLHFLELIQVLVLKLIN